MTGMQLIDRPWIFLGDGRVPFPVFVVSIFWLYLLYDDIP